MDTKEEISKENKFLAPVLIIGGILLLFSVSYATWSIVHAASATNIIRNGCFETTYEEGSNLINLVNITPINDEDGLRTNPFTFITDNTCSANSQYEVLLEIENTNISLEDIKLSINNEKPIKLGDLENRENTGANVVETKKLTNGVLTTGGNIHYSIKMWLDENTNFDNSDSKNFNGKITIVNTSNK